MEKSMQNQKNDTQKLVFQIVLAVGIIVSLHIVFMIMSGKGLFSANPYNSYSKQCAAWLSGRLDLGQDYTWLELAIFNGKYYVSFPPFPSYIILPFAAIFGEKTPDTLISLISVIIGAIYAVKIADHYKVGGFCAVALPVFLYCGTAIWQITVDGWVWFIAQNFSLALTLMSFWYAMTGRKGKTAFFLCCAVGCRPFQIVYAPILLYLLYNSLEEGNYAARIKSLLCRRFFVFVPALVIIISYLLLNFLRFGNPFEFGHNYLPEFTESQSGQFDLSYVGENIGSLLRLPGFDLKTGEIIFENYNGMNIFISFPILIWFVILSACNVIRAAKNKSAAVLRDSRTISCLMIILLAASHVFLILMHKTMGGVHYGNRYISDILPAIFVAICIMSPKYYQQVRRGKLIAANLGIALLTASGFIVSFSGVLNFYKDL